jgi:signal recognition particle subunit SRP54
MTKLERNDHRVLDASRKTRVARGSGSTIAEVNQLLRQYEQMRKMMAQMNRGGLLGGLGKKMMGGLAGGLGGMLGGGGMPGLGGMLGSGSDFGGDEPNGGGSKSVQKKKRHKKRK